MAHRFERRLARLSAAGLAGGLVGLEKESLRVGPDGIIAQTPHPAALGAALTHPSITTDYAEALLELVTPPDTGGAAALATLTELHQFIYRRLEEELLWPASMPCVVDGEASIQIARYGSSNEGLFKHIYRRGLGHRYGKLMQVIAGVHFNYSPPQALWPALAECEGRGDTDAELRALRDACYFGLIRNAQRYGWLLLYLYGASPALCRSFVKGSDHHLQDYDSNTVYLPYATSLRMSDLGYSNRKRCGLKISYDSLDSYLTGLHWAVTNSCLPHELIGIVKDGEYLQLNGNVLQIENEYYSALRPKQPPQGDETPLAALRRRGVRYVELRTIDLNPFAAVGVEADQLRLLEAFLVFCLLHDSPPVDAAEQRRIDANQRLVATRGRDPALRLRDGDREVTLRAWGERLCDGLATVCERLDAGSDVPRYAQALAQARAALASPDNTPSARLLAGMREAGLGFFHYIRELAEQHRDTLLGAPLAPGRLRELDALAARSLREQAERESAVQSPFEEYLQTYRDKLYYA